MNILTKINLINDVYPYKTSFVKVKNNRLYITQKNPIFLMYESGNISTIELPTKLIDVENGINFLIHENLIILECGNAIVIIDSLTKGVVYSILLDKLLVFNLICFKGDFYFITYNLKDEYNFWVIKRGKNNQFKKELIYREDNPFSIEIIHNNTFFLIKDKGQSLICRNLSTKEKIWEIDIKNAFGVEFEGKIYGGTILNEIKHLKDNRFIVHIEGNNLICFCGKTGNILWKANDKATRTNCYEYFNGKIYVVGELSYSIINSENGKIEFQKDYTDEWLSLFGGGKSSGIIHKNRLITVDGYYQQIAVLELQTGKILQSIKLEDRVPDIQSPIIFEDKIFLIDMSKKLHVFDVK